MRKKNRILSTSLREIIHSFPRFLSLFIMSLLGVFVFVGLKATSPDMLNSLDHYYDEHSTYDIRLSSSLGFIEEDVTSIKNLSDIEFCEGVYLSDILYQNQNANEYVIRFLSFPKDVNTITLLEGKMPKNAQEIVVEPMFLERNSLSIGDSIDISSSTLKETHLTITGVVDSPLYFNNATLNANRGKTNVGTGTINFYAYGFSDLFSMDYYSYLYLTVKEAKNTLTGSMAYQKKIDKAMEEIISIKDEASQRRLTDVKTMLEYEIILKEMQYQEQLDTYENYLSLEEASLDSLEKRYQAALQKENITSEEFQEKYQEITTSFETTSRDDPNYSSIEAKYNAYKNIFMMQDTLQKTKADYATTLNKYLLFKESGEKALGEARLSKDNLTNSWHLNSRSSDLTYQGFIDDARSIENLSKIFPLVFYAVAILVSLISMNRMVEDDRSMIGTLKSLGFANHHIMLKYFLFSFIATISGGLLGSFLGNIIIPKLIWSIYTILFDLPTFILGYDWLSILLGFFIALICICGSTIYTVFKVLKEKPAELLRPKAPKNGKRVLLERVKWFWNRLKFSNKVTVRNLFRYKKRVFVTVVGILGCTALMLCGFGIRDAIMDLPEKQFKEVFSYDACAYLNGYDPNSMSLADAFQKDSITDYQEMSQLSITMATTEGILFVVNNPSELDSILHLKDLGTKKTYELSMDKVAISDKLASLLKLSKGDKITFTDTNGKEYQAEIGAVVENYINHYIFISKEAFLSMGGEYETNVVFFTTQKLNHEEEENLTKELLDNSFILNVSFVSDSIQAATDMLGSLNKVVLILIVLAAMLSFVVLYNLSNINIHERKREIATLKVLGFYDKEVDHYITQENLILTTLGVILGLFLGYFLSMIVTHTVEIEKVRFIYHIKPWSFLYSCLLAFLFTFLVNGITHFSLKRIDMIDSLKSVE